MLTELKIPSIRFVVSAETSLDALQHDGVPKTGSFLMVQRLDAKRTNLTNAWTVDAALVYGGCSDEDLRAKVNDLLAAANRVVDLHDNGKLGERGESLAIQLLKDRIREF